MRRKTAVHITILNKHDQWNFAVETAGVFGIVTVDELGVGVGGWIHWDMLTAGYSARNRSSDGSQSIKSLIPQK